MQPVVNLYKILLMINIKHIYAEGEDVKYNTNVQVSI